MRKYARAILEFGTICIVDTGPREAFIKVVRTAWLRTRRQPNSANREVAEKMAEREAIAAGRAAVCARAQPMSTAAAGRGPGTGVRQRAAAAWQQTLSATGRVFVFAKMRIDGTWESSVLEQVPDMAHIEEAMAEWLEVSSAPDSVWMGRSLAIPRYDPVVDNLQAHTAFFGRTSNNLTLPDVSYRAVIESQGRPGG